MPDTMMPVLESRDAVKKPTYCAEERANRLHALIVALFELQPAYSHIAASDDELENIRGNLHSMALDESRELLRLDAFR